MTWSDDLILNYAFQCNEHTELAIAVGERFPRIRHGVISKFGEMLEAELVHRLPNVEVFRNELRSDPLEKWKGLYFCKAAWRGKCSIGIASAQPDACAMFFGLAKETIRPGKVFGDAALQLDAALGKGKTSDEWEWWQWLNEPYSDWNHEQILIDLLKGHSGEALDYIASLLVRVFKCAEKDIDKAVSGTM